jgi:hypothetical protein
MPWRKTVIGTLLVLIVIFAAWWFSGLRPPVEQLINSSGEGGQTSGVITIPLNTGD